MGIVLAAATLVVHGDNGSSLSFTTNKIIYHGFGTNWVCEGPMAVLNGGNLLIAFRQANMGDNYKGTIASVTAALDGTILATNSIYSDATYDCENAALFRTAAGTLLCEFNLYDAATPAELTNALRQARSIDNGSTWTITTVPTTTDVAGCAGKLCQFSDGKILFPFYGSHASGGTNISWVIASTDDGVTWGSAVKVCDLTAQGHYADEPSLVATGGSNVLAFIRGDYGALTTYICRSTDEGATWSAPTNQNLGAVSKVDGLMLPSGLLLISYRRASDEGMAYRLSSDAGATFGSETLIDNNGAFSDYSSAVEIAPGTVALIYGMVVDWSVTNDPLHLAYATLAGVTPAGTITVQANPAVGGTVTGGGEYLPGSNITLSAAANTGWSFLHWNDGVLNNTRSLIVPVVAATYTATFGSTAGIGTALDATNLLWTVGGNAAWYSQNGTKHGTVSAVQSGAVGAGQSSSLQVTTNGPASLQFWWKVSSAPTNQLQFYINTQLVSQISGNMDWNQYVGYIGTSNQVTLTWVYTKNSSAVSGSDAGWVDQVNWMPCPYAAHVPQMFYQDPSGLLASWVLNSTGGFRFARVLANTGGWALKAAGDVDGDDVSDLLFQDTAGNTGGWFMNADGSVRDARLWWTISGWEIKACGDYEGSNRAQVFLQTADGAAAYWRLDTNGNYQSGVYLGNMGGWKLRGAGDLDGDGKAELFWQNAAGEVAVWYHNPTNALIRGVVKYSTGPWALCGVVDIDGDGVSDLLWQTAAGDVGGWIMNSNSTARAANFWWNTGGWKLKAAGR
jgi:hypothetical protein